ncbi:hypothetical protein E2562_011831 [Oryza meyeriana var. granulata]|uniref:Uncharacterized protein n=1 Tax=Oryza meyeriana var. granulata TaxID=110450 RepID=A0A6G1CMY8_9ORYZ|nr:hypothetical protein E2562_011831 [Oryza meyeriana var. granulata]
MSRELRASMSTSSSMRSTLANSSLSTASPSTPQICLSQPLLHAPLHLELRLIEIRNHRCLLELHCLLLHELELKICVRHRLLLKLCLAKVRCAAVSRSSTGDPPSPPQACTEASIASSTPPPSGTSSTLPHLRERAQIPPPALIGRRQPAWVTLPP